MHSEVKCTFLVPRFLVSRFQMKQQRLPIQSENNLAHLVTECGKEALEQINNLRKQMKEATYPHRFCPRQKLRSEWL